MRENPKEAREEAIERVWRRFLDIIELEKNDYQGAKGRATLARDAALAQIDSYYPMED